MRKRLMWISMTTKMSTSIQRLKKKRLIKMRKSQK